MTYPIDLRSIYTHIPHLVACYGLQLQGILQGQSKAARNDSLREPDSESYPGIRGNITL